ncbi:unnamed protein product [Microthlaspi erraticum]|uniref:Uncharacterized protein n=1 Tax=Microthlaspi erraticum TaxID=1685480 RepID=A0A6D2III6_9BRAS|nr:unnamed protein product [Microthlaspi erraticum]
MEAEDIPLWKIKDNEFKNKFASASTWNLIREVSRQVDWCEPLLCFLSTPDRITGPSVFPLSLLLGDLDTAHRQAPPIHLFNRLGNNCLAHLRKSTSRNTSLPY